MAFQARPRDSYNEAVVGQFKFDPAKLVVPGIILLSVVLTVYAAGRYFGYFG